MSDDLTRVRGSRDAEGYLTRREELARDRRRKMKGYCGNPNNYHYGCEVHNFEGEREEPYEECGRFCNGCPHFERTE